MHRKWPRPNRSLSERVGKKIVDPLKLREPGVSARISLMEGAWHSMS